MLGATGGKLISEEKIEILGHDSRRYICEYNGGALIGEQRMILIGNELFIFMSIHPKDKKEGTGASAFFAKISEKKATNQVPQPTPGNGRG
jgi:hypothetical protein